MQGIGILGGGQLAKMLLEEALHFDVETRVLETATVNLCTDLTSHTLDGSLQDPGALRQLVESVDITTYEIEHIHVPTLLALEEQGHHFAPSPKILEIIQDKGKQKDFFTHHHLPTAPYLILGSSQELGGVLDQFPGEKVVVKSCTGGYDGKGVIIVQKDMLDTYDLFSGPCVIESFIPSATELAVMVARDSQGNISCRETVEMVFNEHNTLSYQRCPANISSIIAQKAQSLARSAIEAFAGVGIFAVEFFLTTEGELLINEIAPRPHNSGHHTIEACATSQYAQLLRILLGLPLGSVETIQASVMVNLLGPEGHSGGYQLVDEILLDMQHVYVHIYGKKISKPNRKLGHVTIGGATIDEALQRRQDIHHLLRIVPFHD